MTDFVAKMRHFCRNPRCRSKLPAPVSNPREAFCTRGCHSSFYRKLCLVCEQPMVRKTEHQLICGKRRCRNALRANNDFGRYHASSVGIDPLKTSIKSGIKTGVTTDRPWPIVAGRELTAEQQLHCATTIPDGAGCEWKGGEYRRIESRNHAILREHFNAGTQIQRHRPPVNLLGGYQFPDAPIIDLSPLAIAPMTAVRAVADVPDIPDDLSIPTFLRRVF
jgi:hypothetical protein